MLSMVFDAEARVEGVSAADVRAVARGFRRGWVDEDEDEASVSASLVSELMVPWPL